MKSVLIFLALSLTQSLALADSFEIIRDGRTYTCSSNGPVDPGGAIACAEKAYRGPFSKEQSQELCAGSRTLAPAECGEKAYRGPLNQEQAVRLCRGARTIDPADCAIKAYRGPFNQDEAVQLCARDGSVANADCAIKAYQGPYSKEEAIRLCKSEPQLTVRSLKLMESSGAIREKVQQMKQILGH